MDLVLHNLAFVLRTAWKACLKSSFKSSTSSTPMLSLINLGSAFASDATRCSMRDSTPPKLVAGCEVSFHHFRFIKETRARCTHNEVLGQVGDE